MARIITVANPSTNQPVEISSNATIWSELKTEIQAKGISTDNMKGIVRSTRVTLEASDAILPEGEFTLFLFTEKNKAGK